MENSQTSGHQPFPFYHTPPFLFSIFSPGFEAAVCASLQQGASQTKRKQALLVAAVSFAPCHRREFFPVSTPAAGGGKYKKSTVVRKR